MKKNGIALLIAFGALTFSPTPVGAGSAVDCRKGCKQAAEACADACSDVNLHGLSVRKCKGLCRSPKVRSTCVRLCRTTSIGG